MIFGIGTDIIRIDRIAAAVARHGDRFAGKILGPQEMEKYLRRKAKVEARGIRFLATRFAAKEALVKAMGTGFRQGVWLRDVGMVQEPSGRPVPVFSAAARARLDAAGAGEGHLTLSDEAGLVVAVAVILRRA